jgi:hypothetical protein
MGTSRRAFFAAHATKLAPALICVFSARLSALAAVTPCPPLMEKLNNEQSSTS